MKVRVRKDTRSLGRSLRLAMLVPLGAPLAWMPLAYAQVVDSTDASSSSGAAAPGTSPGAKPGRAPVSSNALPVVSVSGTSDQESPTGQTRGVVAKRNITGTKTNTSLLQTPQSVSVITRDQMDAQGVTTIDGALRYTPGVYTQDATDTRFDQIRGRGFAMDSYLDGLILQSSAFYAVPRIDPYLLERVEVLRGPSSVLYGGGSPAGLVNMVSKRATDEPLHEIMLQMGNHNRYEADLDLSDKIDRDGKVRYRITAVARDADTIFKGVKDQRIAIAPTVTIRPSKDTSLTLSATYQRDPAGGVFNSLPLKGSGTYNPSGRISASTYLGNPDKDYFRRTQYSFGYELEHKFNDVFSFKQNARYMHTDIDYHQSYVGAYLAGSTTRVAESAFLDREHLSQFAIDNQLQAKLDTGPIKQVVLVGIDYSRVLSGVESGTGPIGSLNVFAPDYSTLSTITKTTKRVDAASNQLGVYIQDQLTYGRWTATIGARNDWTNSTIQTASGASTTIQQQSPHAFTWRGGLNYTFDNGIAPYFGYTKSFSPVLGTDFAGNAAKPTTGEQYEVGIKYQPVNYNAMFSAALFNLTQQNVATTDLVHAGFAVQTGEVRSRGLELEAHVELTRSLSAIATYTYLNQVNTKTNVPSALGKRPTISPSNLASFWLDYTIHDGPLRNLGFNAGVRYIGQSAGDAANTFNVGSVVLFDAGAHYLIGKNWRLGLNASNLTNRTYVAYCSGLCYYGAKIGVLGTARYQW